MAINVCIALSSVAIFILVLQVSSEASIRIPAYVPKPPEYVPGRILARRVAEGPGIIQDPPPNGPPFRKSFRPSQKDPRRRVQRQPQRRIDNDSQEVDLSERLRTSLSALSPDALRNPIQAPAPPRPPSPPGVVIPREPIRPPSPPTTVGFGPPAPPFPGPAEFGPPALPPTSRPPTVGPPALPPDFSTPAPPSSGDSQVTSIKCIEFDGRQMFQALLSLPAGYETVPVLEDRPTIDLTTNPTCRVIPTSSSTRFNLILSKYEACGVRKCRQSNGETWNCLILRFPLLNGIKLPEDELVEIRCRPHDATADHNAILSVATAKYANKEMLSNRPPTVFEGSQEFKCEIGLFRQLPGTQEFNSRVEGDTALELGEKVQLWSIVKAGDGWQYSRLTEVVILKEDEDKTRSTLNTIVMVYSDGCRNDNYKVIAQNHPFRDNKNPLINKFTFRIFMFQDMQPGDRLLISARVIGCIREADCAPTICADDNAEGYGRRKREVTEHVITTEYTVPKTGPPYPPDTAPPLRSSFVRHPNPLANTTNWSRNLAIRVKMPGESVQTKTVQIEDCKLYLYISLGIGILFCVVCSTCAAVAAVQFNRGNKKTTNEILGINPILHEPQKPPPKPKKSLEPRVSSSESESIATDMSVSSAQSNCLRELPVPPTVKHRKKRVNAELIDLFNNEEMVPYNTGYPPMLNYYGYMVVPRPPPNQKKSVRSAKRANRLGGDGTHNNRHRRCDNFQDTESPSSEESSTHTSIIQITSSGSDTISHRSVSRPKPKPRSLVNENIYHEIRQDTLPTMV